MNTISKFKISLVTFVSLFSSSVFAGIAPPIVVSEPSILALLGAGAVAVLYVAKKRKK
ncbi:MAG: PEP-CTERM sorting domain-containing protein [Gammaproteobacteria bacterium]|nr:PEP-CTERM sorting domain-containing protein [Gammaproteobacteria bacterium]